MHGGMSFVPHSSKNIAQMPHCFQNYVVSRAPQVAGHKLAIRRSCGNGAKIVQKILSDLTGHALAATDGDLGKVDDFLFDDNYWTVRHLIADTSRWLPGRRVMISPMALGKIDPQEKRVAVSLTKEEVKNSPDIDLGAVSREHEMSYYDYYGWPYYWVGGDVWGAGVYPTGLAAAKKMAIDAEQQKQDVSVLRSARQTTGYYLQAVDGEIGHVDDFIIDDETWEIRYMVADTQNWWPGKKVLVSPEWIDHISWSDSRVYVDLSQEAIKTGPEFDPQALDRDYEQRLYGHYGKPGYWDLR
jgi:hypothetical protein